MAEASPAEQTEPERTVVYLGNRKVISIQDGERVPTAGKFCTTVTIRADATLLEAVQEITSPQGVWQAHSDAAGPAWVAAAGPMAEPITQILAAHYRCEIREPEPAEV